MGSLSTALNALATSSPRIGTCPYINPGATPARVVRAARVSTVFFSILLVLIGAATAYAILVLELRIIPIVLGIFGYTYGSLLGVFLAGMLTKTRGNNTGNILAMIGGFVAVCVLSGLHNTIWETARRDHGHPLETRLASGIAFPWRIAFGSIITFLHRDPLPHPSLRSRKSRAPRGNSASLN